ncbi:MAG: sulfurtransferase TusA family protein [Caldilineaceae bacterium]|nr:sulfurtransferase TusA family protein [Caldilineaceae bacterium]
MTTIDARGLSCPQPVILANKAIAANRFPFVVLVETVTSRENVRRMAEGKQCMVEVEQIGDEFRLKIDRKSQSLG